MLPEAATVHYANLRTSADKFGDAAIMRLDLGNVVPATAYIHAQQVSKLMRDRFREVFDRYSVIVGPANPVRAGAADAWTTEIDGRTIDLRQVGPEYTGIYNLAGNPAIVIPAGFSSEGTPIGLQIAGRWWDEPTVLQVAHAFEQATEWHSMRPPLPRG
jgi:aspartyl-tRNA(Asn)/glutamyl-tRNA(Gln) amidotransferase subunit A